MDVREFQAGQGDQFASLLGAVVPDSLATLADPISESELFLQDPASFTLGAYVDDEPVGLAWGLQMRSPIGRLTTYLHQLEVRENWRRRGIGFALVSEAMALGVRRGSTKFWLSTGAHNEGAQALYEALGGDRKPLGDVNYWWDLGGVSDTMNP